MKLNGTAVSQGIAVGEVFVYEPFSVTVSETLIQKEERNAHIRRFLSLRAAAAKELSAIVASLEATDPERAKIFIAHGDILEDEAVNEEIEEGIKYDNWACEWAIEKIYAKFIRMLQKAPDPLIQERAVDLQDVRTRLLRLYYGVEEKNLATLAKPVVVAARDLLPSDTATLNRGKVLAILTERGGPTSHSAIIARSYGIPAVLGISGLLEKVKTGTDAAVDAMSGEVLLEPDEEACARFIQKRLAWQKKAAKIQEYLDKEPVTADGVRIDIGLNIGSGNEDELENEKYTDLVGLFRTEFLYMGRPKLPTEEEQYAIYKKVLQTYGKRPVTLRTLDIGGDKTLDCMCLPKEENPFLGNRALRLCFSRQDIFETQLRAAMRASVHGNLWLMLPMVGSLDDIRRAKAIIEKVKATLEAEGIAYSKDVKIGIMVEIPAIAMIADKAAKEVDFASIGTNDLCQYLTAVDRLNPDVACYYQSYHPALLRMIHWVVKCFNEAGKPICVCGEMGGELSAAPVLVGFGIRKLSMGASSIAAAKRVLQALTLQQMEAMAKTVVDLDTAADVEAYLEANIAD